MRSDPTEAVAASRPSLIDAKPVSNDYYGDSKFTVKRATQGGRIEQHLEQ